MPNSLLRRFVVPRLKDWGLLLFAVFVCALGWCDVGMPMQVHWFSAVSSDAAWLGLMALGTMLLHHAGRFDFSVGALFGLALLILGAGLWTLPPLLVMLAAFVVCVALGVFNGWLSLKLRASWLVTACLFIAYRELCLLLVGLGGAVLHPAAGAAIVTNAVPAGASIARSLVLLLLAAGAVRCLFERTAFGRNIVAIGIDEQRAKYLGLQPWRYQLLAFGVSAALVAMAAVAYYLKAPALSVDAGIYLPLQTWGALILAYCGLRRDRPAPVRLVLACMVLALLHCVAARSAWPGADHFFVAALIVLALWLDRERFSRAS